MFFTSSWLCALNSIQLFFYVIEDKRESCQSTWNTYWFFFLLSVCLCLSLAHSVCSWNFFLYIHEFLLLLLSIRFFSSTSYVTPLCLQHLSSCCLPLLFDGLALQFWLLRLRILRQMVSCWLNSMCMCFRQYWLQPNQIFVDSMNVSRTCICTMWFYLFCYFFFEKVSTWNFSMKNSIRFFFCHFHDAVMNIDFKNFFLKTFSISFRFFMQIINLLSSW